MKRNFFKIFQFQINFKEYFRFFFVFEWNIIIINVVFFCGLFLFSRSMSLLNISSSSGFNVQKNSGKNSYKFFIIIIIVNEDYFKMNFSFQENNSTFDPENVLQKRNEEFLRSENRKIIWRMYDIRRKWFRYPIDVV